jgi:phosphoglycolate phosphatase
MPEPSSDVKINTVDAADPELLASLPGRDFVLLDFDGTIGDTAEIVARPPVQAMHEIGMTDEEIGDATRLAGPTWPLAFIQLYGMDPDLAQAVTDRAHEIRRASDYQYDFDLFDGAIDFLEKLGEAGKKRILLTSRETPYIKATLEAKGLTGYFDFVQGQDDHSMIGKTPLVGIVFERYGIDGGDCMTIGDRKYDVEMGHAWNAPAIGCAWGVGGVQELAEAGADLIVESFPQLTSLLLPKA